MQPSIANSTDLYTTWLRARGSLASRYVVSTDPGTGHSQHRKPPCATTFRCLEFADGNSGRSPLENRLERKPTGCLPKNQGFLRTHRWVGPLDSLLISARVMPQYWSWICLTGKAPRSIAPSTRGTGRFAQNTADFSPGDSVRLQGLWDHTTQRREDCYNTVS